MTSHQFSEQAKKKKKIIKNYSKLPHQMAACGFLSHGFNSCLDTWLLSCKLVWMPWSAKLIKCQPNGEAIPGNLSTHEKFDEGVCVFENSKEISGIHCFSIVSLRLCLNPHVDTLYPHHGKIDLQKIDAFWITLWTHLTSSQWHKHQYWWLGQIGPRDLI